MHLIILILAGVGITVPLRRYVVEPIVVASASMEPALPVGARFFADKLTPRLRAPKRGVWAELGQALKSWRAVSKSS